jgi:hypothetical protein
MKNILKFLEEDLDKCSIYTSSSKLIIMFLLFMLQSSIPKALCIHGHILYTYCLTPTTSFFHVVHGFYKFTITADKEQHSALRSPPSIVVITLLESDTC